MDADPITQFFPSPEYDEDNILYTALGVEPTATLAEINKAYRKLALVHHPDKHSGADEQQKDEASRVFQRVGFAYAVLRDESRRKRYDTTGLTSESAFLSQGEEMGWEAYFEQVFEQVTKAKLDEMKKEYQGSSEELSDLLAAYTTHSGSLELILSHIPHSSHADESRFVNLIDAAIARGEIVSIPDWEAQKKDEKSRNKRRREGEKEAGEAEEAAREMGVWDEFYGSGKAAPKKKKGNGKGKKDDAPEEEDTASLQALIQRNAAKRSDSFLSSMEAKYGPGGSASTAKKGGKASGKKAKKEEEHAAPDEMDDATFAKIQAEIMDRKNAASTSSSKPSKAEKGKK